MRGGWLCIALFPQAWNTQHWVCLRTMHGRHVDTTWPACLALSGDGALLVSGSTGPFGHSTIKVRLGRAGDLNLIMQSGQVVCRSFIPGILVLAIK